MIKMQQKSHLSRVKDMMPYNWCLRQTLRPYYAISRVILMDWCFSYMNHEHGLVKFARYTSVVFVVLLLFGMTLFQVVSLVTGVMTMTSVHNVIPYVVWFVSLPITLLTQLDYLFYRKKYLAFFEEWSNFERQFALKNSHHVVVSALRKTRIVTLISRMVVKTGTMIALGYVVVFLPNAPFLLSHHQFFRDALTLPVLVTCHLVIILLILVLKTLGETVPALIFYHGGLEVLVLKKEVNQLFNMLNSPSNLSYSDKVLNCRQTSSSSVLFSIKVRQLMKNYENLKTLVTCANRLFGSLMFSLHSMEFIVICTMLYSVLYESRSYPKNIGVFSTVLIVNIYDLVYSTLLTAKIYYASEDLRNQLSSSLNQYWDVTPKDERDILIKLLNCLQADPFAATPLDLYRVTPSVLLTMISLILSYVIIMLQSN